MSNQTNREITVGIFRKQVYLSRDDARKKFLEKIKLLATEVLTSLKDDILPLYKNLHPSELEVERYSFKEKKSLGNISFSSIVRNVEWVDKSEKARELTNKTLIFWDALCQSPNLIVQSPGIGHGWAEPIYFYPDETREKLIELKVLLMAWAEKWNLREKWFLDYVLHTLKKLCMEPDTEELDWCYNLQKLMYKQTTAKEIPPPLNFRPWDMDAGEKWGDYKKECLEMVESLLEDYRNRMQPHISENRRTPKNKIGQKLEEAYYKWLISFQVKKCSYSNIARTENMNNSTIRKGIESLADLVGLTLRELTPSEKPGRPRHSG